ncbi:MAG: energy-coupling factor transporter transmembrane protein EcfT [Anaerolineales bacterium]|nr:energy-coupling factor transporter transmembrane protein EcfT [Anaerolineales bacterium]
MKAETPRRPSGVEALHPLTKLTLVLVAAMAGAALPTTLAVLAVFLGLLVPLAAWGRCLGVFLRTCLRVLLPFFVSLVLIQGFFTPGPTVLMHVGPFRYTLEGLQVALLFSARLLVGLGAATLLMLVTRPDALMRALVARGLPNQIAYIVVTALQIVPTFQARAHSILDAQRSRGLETEGRLTVRVRAFAPLVGPLILSSLMQIEERAIALEARAFSRTGRRTSLVALRDTRGQTFLRWVLLLAGLALVAARLVLWRAA